jgi:hypothetical protein
MKRFAACAVVLCGGLFGGGQSIAAADSGCPNQALRSGPAALLPDCRGYERVSAADKNGYDVLPQVQAASDGSRVALRSFGSFAGAGSASLQTTYLAARGSGGSWSSRPVSPPIEPYAFIGQSPFLDWSPDLSKAIVQGAPSPKLTPDAVSGVPNLYLRANDTDSYSLVSPGLLPFPSVFEPGYEPGYGGASADFSHVVFGIGIALTANTPAASASNIYEYVGGGLRLVGILPAGEAAPEGALLGSGGFLGASTSGSALHAVSEDGSRIFFTSLASAGLFARVDGTATVPVSASGKTPLPSPNPAQPATYWTATANGSAAFFTSKSALTNASNTGPGNLGNDLYRFAVDSGELTDLSVDSVDPNGAEVLGVVGASRDGEYAYFVAKGLLVPGKGTLGAANLYVWHAGSVRYIATLAAPTDELNWTLERSAFAAQIPARVSADGREAVITTTAPQPGYNNTDPVTGARHSEVYRYNADLAATSPAEAWTCISCKPSGQPATGDASLIPPHIGFAEPHGAYLSRAIGDGHRAIIFNSADALLPQDVNHTTDVYEWRNGQISLITTGTSPSPSYFADADASGENVYIATRQQLVPTDNDDLVDIYDARVGGGTPPAPPSIPCSGESCRTPGSVPPAAEPGSATFIGPGNPKPRKHGHRRKHPRPHHRRGKS